MTPNSEQCTYLSRVRSTHGIRASLHKKVLRPRIIFYYRFPLLYMKYLMSKTALIQFFHQEVCSDVADALFLLFNVTKRSRRH